jgi:hypothetical protein
MNYRRQGQLRLTRLSEKCFSASQFSPPTAFVIQVGEASPLAPDTHSGRYVRASASAPPSVWSSATPSTGARPRNAPHPGTTPHRGVSRGKTPCGHPAGQKPVKVIFNPGKIGKRGAVGAFFGVPPNVPATPPA